MRKSEAKGAPPWKKKAPRKRKPVKLTEAEKAEARRAAAAAGRPYPNLVDNMRVAARRNRKAAAARD